jgi:membrane-bound inhibitor of C-type lysozyme
MTTIQTALGVLAFIASTSIQTPQRPAPAPVSPVKATGPFIFDCRAQGTEVGELHATFYATQPELVMLEHVGLAKPAFQVRAASGAKYEGDGVSFWEARGEATVQWPGSDMTCKRRQEGK